MRKLLGLVGTGAEITVVSPEVLPEIQALPDIKIINRAFRPSDTHHANIIFAATDNPQVNHLIGKNLQNGQWFNNTGCSKDSDFYSPAVIRKNGLAISITTKDLNPVRAKLCKQILSLFLNQKSK